MGLEIGTEALQVGAVVFWGQRNMSALLLPFAAASKHAVQVLLLADSRMLHTVYAVTEGCIFCCATPIYHAKLAKLSFQQQALVVLAVFQVAQTGSNGTTAQIYSNATVVPAVTSVALLGGYATVDAFNTSERARVTFQILN